MARVSAYGPRGPGFDSRPCRGADGNCLGVTVEPDERGLMGNLATVNQHCSLPRKCFALGKFPEGTQKKQAHTHTHIYTHSGIVLGNGFTS